jgi:hypothetical protein
MTQVEGGRSMKLRCSVGTSVVTLLLLAALAGPAQATGPGGWDHVGDGGTVGTPSLNGKVNALYLSSTRLYVGGEFTSAGGDLAADRIATWNLSVWAALGTPTSRIADGAVNAIARDPNTGFVYAGGTFTALGGSPANYLAVWNGTSWAPFCAPISATVYALQIVGRNLYVGGAFGPISGVPNSDRLLRCDLDTGAASATVNNPAHVFSGSVYALTADSNGVLYAGGGFTDLEGMPAADNVAYLDGTGWHPMMGPGVKVGCSCSVDNYVRSLTTIGTNVYVGTDDTDVAGIPQADKVARWDGATWSAVGSNTAGTDGWFPTVGAINGLTNSSPIYATGSFQNANGDPTADFIASFDGTNWHAVGSDGAGNGPLGTAGNAVACCFGHVYVGGNFTSAGGDTQAKYIAAYPGYYQLNVVFAGTGGGYVQTQALACHTSCSGSYPPGTVLHLGAASNVDAKFLGWSGAGCSGTSSCQVTMNADTTVTVNFTAFPYCSNFAGYTATGGVPTQLKIACRDASGSPITYSIVTPPAHGTLGPVSVTYGDGYLNYTPTVGYTGPDQFVYTGTDANGVASPKPVSINVTDPGYAHANTNFALLSGTFTPGSDGALSVGVKNTNTFAVTATSVTITSLSAVAATAGAHKKVVTFLKSSKKVAIKAKKTAKLKGRVKGARLAQLKRLHKVRVRITVVLKTPKGIRSTFTRTGTLRAPK